MFNLFIEWNASPEIFTIPGIDWPVRWYGLSWAAAFIVSHFYMNRIFKAEGRTDKQLDSLTLYIILGTVIGARIGHCMFYDAKYYLQNPLDILKVYQGGLASHGGAIGIIIAMWLYCRKTKESWLWLFDRLVIVVPVASALIRLGNLMNSEIVGRVTSVAWGFKFPNNDEDRSNFLQHGVEIPVRHPAQLYEAIYCFALFALMYWLWKNKRSKNGPGYLFGVLCVTMFTMRFLVEFIKENQSDFENQFALNMGQILSIPFVLLGVFMIWRAGKLKKTEEPEDITGDLNIGPSK